MIKGKIRKIFLEHWDEFVKLYGHRVRLHVFKEVAKMIKCGGLMYPEKYEGVHGITYCVEEF